MQCVPSCFPPSFPFSGFLEDFVVVVSLPLSFAFVDRGQWSPAIPWRDAVVSVRRGTCSRFDEGEGQRVAVCYIHVPPPPRAML